MKVKVGDVVKFQYGAKLRTGKVVEMNVGDNHKCILIEFLDEDLRGTGHNGNNRCKGTYSGNNYAYIDLDGIRFVFGSEEIHITRSGNILNAVMKTGGKVVKRAEAKCHPSDLFDFETGTRLAINRLFEKEAIRFYLKGVLPSNRNAHYGFIGESTSMKDSLGNPLFVGDEVIYFNAKKPRGVQYSIVVHSRNDNSTFIKGIKNDCRRNNATIEDYVVIKYAPYTDLQQGDEIDGVEAVIEE